MQDMINLKGNRADLEISLSDDGSWVKMSYYLPVTQIKAWAEEMEELFERDPLHRETEFPQEALDMIKSWAPEVH